MGEGWGRMTRTSEPEQVVRAGRAGRRGWRRVTRTSEPEQVVGHHQHHDVLDPVQLRLKRQLERNATYSTVRRIAEETPHKRYF